MVNCRQAVIGVALLSVLSSAGQAQRRAMSGDLTKALATYTGDEFFNLVNGLGFSADSTKGRLCRGSAACNQGGRVMVSVAEVTDADSVSAAGVSQFGTIVARALVRGNDTTVMYNMKPQGRYRYYLIVTRESTWIMEELDIAGANRAHRTVASGTFRTCNHPFQRGARADFRTCGAAQGNDQQASLLSRARQMWAGSKQSVPSYGSLLAYLRQGSEPPIWIGCALGCCTADQ